MGILISQSEERKELSRPIRREEEYKKRDFKNVKGIDPFKGIKESGWRGERSGLLLVFGCTCSKV